MLCLLHWELLSNSIGGGLFVSVDSAGSVVTIARHRWPFREFKLREPANFPEKMLLQ